ncbi:ABC transporter permease [Curtobacterium sp. PhB191]|uniref:ABC transporter permease n=1 Tax=Curtobacterium sp. PhB191 TaxID=2485202 RepID=UPI00104D0161|nr:ABC transporter permease [Curtobacterium sp. PhB191]
MTAPVVEPAASAGRVASDSAASSGQEARPTPATSRAAHGAPAPTTVVGSAPRPTATLDPTAAPTPEPASIATLVEDDVTVPDYPPQQDLLPPAPTSPTVHTVPFDTAAVASAPAPVSPIDAAPRTAPASAPSPVPSAGQPRFSVPGLEHVVVEGTEPEPVGPIGFRTPRRFAHQQAAATAVTPAPTPASAHVRSFDAVLQAPSVPTASSTAPVAPNPVVPVTAPVAEASASVGAEPGLPTELLDQPVAAAAQPEPRRALGATPGAVLGAVAGIATLGLAAWWFTAPATVHGVGIVLGLLALVVSLATLRHRAATWQRPVALLGAVLGGVGTLVLLWAVASALLPLAGVTLPDLTGTGTTPTLAP